MPLSYVDDFIGRPVGLLVLARSHEELVLIKVMSGWVVTFAPRKYPEGFSKQPTLAYQENSMHRYRIHPGCDLINQLPKTMNGFYPNLFLSWHMINSFSLFA